MKNLHSKIISIFLMLSLFLAACTSYKNLDRENLKNLYSLDNTLTAKYLVQHIDSLQTVVYYQFNFDDFLYLPNQDSSAMVANYKLSYQLFPNIQAIRILDSASVVFRDSLNYKKNNSSLGYFELQIPKGQNNTIRLHLEDLNSHSEIINLININKTEPLSRQNFILQASDQLPMINSSAAKKTDYKLIYNDLSTKTIHVKYFKSFLKPAQPPYLDNPYNKVVKVKADSIFTLRIENGISENFQFSKQGVYHFMADSNSSIGFTMPVFTEGYPWITTPAQMIAPLRYIATSNEYEKMFAAQDKTEAVNQFWINLSSNESRAQAMMTIYYNRVQEANLLFSSEKEGWLTDRGMIYIVFGPPDKVFKSNDLETWNYGLGSTRTTLTFNFLKTTNPFTDNDYLLDRAPSYANSWLSAVEFWRR